MGPILVWDAPVRVVHWLAVLCVAGAWLTSESERWRWLHVTLGLTLAGLVAFRLLWGVIGTRHARFGSFLRGPQAAARYLTALLRGRPEHYTGHNPAGALAIIGMLVLAAAVTLSGWVAWQEFFGEWVGELHEGMAAALLALVGLHVAGVGVGSWRHRENFVAAMITGRKLGSPGEALRGARSGVAASILAAVLCFWWWQWQAPVQGQVSGEHPQAEVRAPPGSDARDDDD